MQVVLLAGGLGTRLASVSDGKPKALMDVAGRPFADHQMAMLTSEGVTHVIYSIGHRGSQIEDHFGSRAFGITIDYVADGERLMGTGGALRRVLDSGLLAEQFLMMYGDTLLQIPLAALMSRLADNPDWGACMAVFQNLAELDASNVVCLDDGTILYDKSRPVELVNSMTHIDYGVTALQRSVIEELIEPEVATDMASIFYTIARSRALGGFEVRDRFFEIGTPESWAELDAHLRARS